MLTTITSYGFVFLLGVNFGVGIGLYVAFIHETEGD